MTSIDMECPKCGAPGTVPRDKAQSRLVCRKCHAVFHLTPLGRAVLGEPPHPDAKKDDGHHAPHHEAATPREESVLSVESLSGVSPGVLASLAGVILLGLIGIGMTGGWIDTSWTRRSVDTLTPRAQSVADAIADDQVDSAKSLAVPGTETEVGQFVEGVRNLLAPLRTKSPTKKVEAKVLVLEESRDGTQAQVVAIFTPLRGTSRDQQISEAVTEETNGRTVTSEVNLAFTKDPSGVWRVDGKRLSIPTLHR